MSACEPLDWPDEAIRKIRELCEWAEANPVGWGGPMVVSFARSVLAALPDSDETRETALSRAWREGYRARGGSVPDDYLDRFDPYRDETTAARLLDEIAMNAGFPLKRDEEKGMKETKNESG
jgi:hypothetical protein